MSHYKIFGILREASQNRLMMESVFLDKAIELCFVEEEITAFGHWSEKKRTEKILGRVAAKTLLSKAYGIAAKTARIKNYPSGTPYAEVGESQYKLSISHTPTYGAAVVTKHHQAAIGIDLVLERDVSFELKNRVCDSKELTWIDSGIISFCELWALKEAALKTWQTGMHVPIWDVHIEPKANRSFSVYSDSLTALSGTVFSPEAQLILGLAWSDEPLLSSQHLRLRDKHMGC